MSGIWSEIPFSTTPNPASDCVLYPIDDQKVLSVVGPDSSKFMQGQFTCNLNDINPNQFRPGACCNAKGRMVTSFNLMQMDQGHYLLGLHESLVEITQNHLKKYMVFFKTQMQATDYIVAGITGAPAILSEVFATLPQADYEQVMANGHVLVKLPHAAGYQMWLTPHGAPEILKALSSKYTLSTNNLWNLNLIQHGLGYVTAHTSEAFIPQMMNFSQYGGISFNKGCYTGQEIVARMQ